ncbi:transcriptional regulator [Erysipelothrix larvae]|uniref:Transcriptional regulator n=1 Tax=Erysipelothrix larvae TaxID=1514105 RepID=A0A120JTQ4_9FIRM|nr:arsenite efflux transporter metallochaperone ArsD [Erysipelothrix larvae]AMC93603.1 transcriptional regulator [Erysipelothrix larvae]
MKIEIFDPAMCCSTGVCGTSVDKELLRVASLVDRLEKSGVDIRRYQLTNEPQEFIANQLISELLNKDSESLPITLVNGKVVKTKGYLSNQEFDLLFKANDEAHPTKCNCKNGCC